MWSKINQRIQQALATVRQAFRVVTGTVDTSTKVQLLQLNGLAGEQLDGAEYFQHYGFTSAPLPGSMGIAIPLNGNTSHTVIVATEHGAYRLTALKPGEVALYTDEGAKIVLKRGRVIETECDIYRIKCNAYEVEAKTSAGFITPQLTASQQFIAEGKISGNGGMAIKGGKGKYTATFEGNINHSGGVITSVDVTINGIKIGTHRHPTPHGTSDTPIN
ncbi:UNVERIFIED_ORG: phage baseplate assembly protein V [Citrobacter freundii]|uniref:phage baseplate assembly protein V n=1 Tax=Citrobacter portucalensis TaxID=1639133 RepID=UPI001172EB5B|nr:phage baseplate assembly protein V [Citrobacter portucalensis]NUH52174.1 phage baseplate assembly protein [Citrobacter portucalensis]NUH52717.1 phage baseplate assembly protein [Citrobacter portucalensis]NUH54008.1 phage baseplate assembly protein [Citrobacter portucalensis]